MYVVWWIVINWNIEVWSLTACEVQFVIQPQLPFFLIELSFWMSLVRVLDPEGDRINYGSLRNEIPSFPFFLPDWGSILHYYPDCFYRQKKAVAKTFILEWNLYLHSKAFAILVLCGLAGAAQYVSVAEIVKCECVRQSLRGACCFVPCFWLLSSSPCSPLRDTMLEMFSRGSWLVNRNNFKCQTCLNDSPSSRV